MMEFFIRNVKKIPSYGWILIAIILLGIFLRTYNLHSWLKFRDDQSRDAALVSQVVNGKAAWPLAGPYMSYSGLGDHIETNSFHLGPIYYYFQIISAKIFGNYADKSAYPDVFFGIFSIFLLYVFLRFYFERNLSLGIAGLYAISAYFIQYSRFAWNTNLIPFFVLLLLISLYKILEKNEKTPWIWAILLGIALGVGVQLHAIIMVLFFVVAFLVFLFSMKKNFRAWKKWAVIILIFGALNAPQIWSELKTNFSNTKILLNFSSQDNNAQNEASVGKLALIRNDLDCNIEANSYFLSSFGGSNCTYGFLIPAEYGQIRTKNFSKISQDVVIRIAMFLGVAFSVFGYFLLARFSKKESETGKKNYLYLIILFVAASFVIMIPLGIDKFNDLRYYSATFFVPYILLGLLIKFFSEKFSKSYIYLVVGIFVLLIYTNAAAMAEVATSLMAGDRTCSSRSTTIGELEPVAQYMVSNSNGQKLIYFGGDKAFRVAYGPLAYILMSRGINSTEIDADPKMSEANAGPTYMVSCKSGLEDYYPSAQIGSIYVFRLNK